jgi:hypothetical protein
MDPSHSRRPGLAPCLLGAFICWQLFFMITYNYLQLLNGPMEDRRVRDREPQGIAAKATLALQKAEYRWADLTGQYQAWWLFALPPHESLFPLIELRWSDPELAPVRLHAVQEPADPSRYFRLPDTDDRLFHYENRCAVVYNPWNQQLQTEDQVASCLIGGVGSVRYARYVDDQLSTARGGWWRPALAYMRWRLHLWESDHPDTPRPDEVWLYCRAYPTPGQEGSWTRPAPQDRLLARWRTGWQPPEGDAPLEVFDPRSAAFRLLSRTAHD